MRRHILCAAIAAAVAFAQTEKADHPTGNRTTPPTITSVAPRGMARGTTVEFTVEGLNLANAQGILFDQPGIKGRVLRVKELPDLPDIRLGSNGTLSTVDLGPLPPHNQVTIEVDVSPEAPVGPVGFRIQTPLGTSPDGKFLVEPYYGESPDREPNNTPEQAFESYLPTILVGEISKPGDADYFKIKVKAGEQLVFENGAVEIGSTLQPVVEILREDQSVVKAFGNDGGTSTEYFAHKFDTAGTYYVRVTDYQQSGRASNTYRIKVGPFRLATSAFPLGVQQGKESEVSVHGLRVNSAPLKVKGEPSPGEIDVLRVRPAGSFSELKLAVGRDPEVLSSGTNHDVQSAQTLTVPVTVNGRLDAPKEEHYYKFHAAKGEKVVLEVLARRFDSDLDSFLEVLDAKGKPIETATVRAVTETFTALRDHDSASRGIRITSWTGWSVGDYVLVGNEIMRVEALPRGPDDDTVFDSFGGQRIAWLGTSSEMHFLDRPVYKIQIHPPGTKFTPNGLPLVHLFARNDDGGSGMGKDSKIDFVAPADGDYVVRLADVRGLGGENFAYRLNIRPPRPDFRLAVSPRNPNVPAGGSAPLNITALRLDGYDGPIEIGVEDLPPGLKASPSTILPGQVSTTVLLTADARAVLEKAAPLKVAGKAKVGAETLARYANPEDKLKYIALMPKADVQMTAETKEVVLEPGGTAEVAVRIQRQNGFGGRVPVDVRNLPPRVRVLDVGLNGVLINENETQRSFTLEALDNAPPVDQWIYVGGTVETRSPLQSVYSAPQAIHLVVKPRKTQLSEAKTPPASNRATAPK